MNFPALDVLLQMASGRSDPTLLISVADSEPKRESKVMELTPMTHNQSHTQIQRVSCPEQGCCLISVSTSTQDGEI